MAESVEEKLAELNRLLATGTYGRLIPKLARFLRSKGHTDRRALAGEGWMLILVGMVPRDYSSIDDLLQAVKNF